MRSCGKWFSLLRGVFSTFNFLELMCLVVVEVTQLDTFNLNNVEMQVFRYNLIVPFGRQMFGLKWEKELDRLNEKKADC